MPTLTICFRLFPLCNCGSLMSGISYQKKNGIFVHWQSHIFLLSCLNLKEYDVILTLKYTHNLKLYDIVPPPLPIIFCHEIVVWYLFIYTTKIASKIHRIPINVHISLNECAYMYLMCLMISGCSTKTHADRYVTFISRYPLCSCTYGCYM